MEQSERAALVNRLKSIAGHVSGIASMLEQDRYCVDVIKQIQAAQAALAKANQIILDNHLRTCLTTAIRGEDPDERERVLSEISDVFSVNSRS
jgi:DNA-binding FrmR family transcriptional regulator